MHIHIGSHFGADTVYHLKKFSYTHSYLGGSCGQTIPSHLLPLSSSSFMTCPLVAQNQQMLVQPLYLPFYPVDCDTIFISSMESNTGFLHDR